jgi:hypothetical protein
MKSSTIKKIVVKLAPDNIYEIEVDSEDFDDPLMEAATRAIEQCKIKKYGIIRPFAECWDKKDDKNQKKHQLFNCYWVLVNASCYKKAELLRERFKEQEDVDLAKEPICGHVK